MGQITSFTTSMNTSDTAPLRAANKPLSSKPLSNEDKDRHLKKTLIRVDGAFGLKKHKKMVQNPFLFMRGSAPLFYEDLANDVVRLPEALQNLPLTTVMGDCHVANFGFFTEEGSHGDSVIFAPNDFDDACIGHAAWDLLRFSISVILCQEYCEQEAKKISNKKSPPVISGKHAEKALHAFLDSYLATCTACLNEHYFDIQAYSGASSALLQGFKKKAKQRARGGKKFLTKSTLAKEVAIESLPLRFRSRKDRLQVLDDAQKKSLIHAFAPYMNDTVLDVVKRLDAGTGSNNMDRYYFLVGPAQQRDAETGGGQGNAAITETNVPTEAYLALCHVVEVKQQRDAAPVYYFRDVNPTNQLNAAHLTVNCQRRMMRKPDLILDAAEWQGKHWLIRSRHHARVGCDPEDIGIGADAVDGGFDDYAATCGRALALVHARGDRRSVRFERAMLDTLPHYTRELIKTAYDYVHHIERDCSRLKRLLHERES